jgi:hypothetical protein
MSVHPFSGVGLVFKGKYLGGSLKIESTADRIIAFQMERGTALGAFRTAAWLTSLWIDLDWLGGFKAPGDSWIWEN